MTMMTSVLFVLDNLLPWDLDSKIFSITLVSIMIPLLVYVYLHVSTEQTCNIFDVYTKVGWLRTDKRKLKQTKNATQETTSKTSKMNQKGGKKKNFVCPYSDESDFVVEIGENIPPTPLHLFQDWTDPNKDDYGKPLGARWLNAGISGQDTPGILRAGLKRLPDSKFFLVEEPFRIRDELFLKASALDDPARRQSYLVYEEDSLAAQREVLDLFLSYLPKRYPDLYTLNTNKNTLYVAPLDKTFFLDDWVDSRPLELCERIVQEDLVIMRPPRPETDSFDQYAMAAAAVVFSFNQLPERLSKPVAFIHAPVPGYERHLRKTMDLTFSKLLKIEQPLWRNNWGIAPTGNLCDMLYDHRGSTALFANESLEKRPPSRDEIKSKFLHVEYQTIRRLPRSKCLLFTVKTMRDPMSSLEQLPLAAGCLAASIRGLSPEFRKYKGLACEETCNAVLSYLDEICERQ